MKYGLHIGVAVLLLSACNNSTETQKAERTENVLNAAAQLSTTTTDSMCYLLAEGTKKQDTTIVQLAITGNGVTGSMRYMPYEKDSRNGTLSGSKTGKNIQAQWVYMQEGMTDSIAVNFRLDNDILMQQLPAYDKATGKEYYPADAEYKRHYLRIDCNTASCSYQIIFSIASAPL